MKKKVISFKLFDSKKSAKDFLGEDADNLFEMGFVDNE